VLIVAWFGSDYFILRRVKALLDVTKQLAGGDLSARSGLSYGRGELSQLAFAFDEMAATIEQQSLQLRQAEARYRALVENTPAVIYTISIDNVGNMLYVGPQIETLLGFTPTELTADPELWSKQIHPADRQRIQAEFQKAQNNVEPFSYEYRIYTRDGRELWVHDKADIVQDESGHPSYFQGFIIDISERKQAEDAIKLAYSELSQIFNTAADGMCVIDQEFNVLRINDAFSILLGTPKEMI
jgi:PAS domain S-box-containing protein